MIHMCNAMDKGVVLTVASSGSFADAEQLDRRRVIFWR